MPRVQSYQSQFQSTPVPRPRRQVGYTTPQLQTPRPAPTPSPEALGAGFGQALEQVGSELFLREQKRQDEVRITQAERKLSDWEIQNLYHPEKGALNVQGEQVYGLEQKLGDDFDKTSGEIAEGLNDRQRDAFSRISQGRRASVMVRLNQHVAGEMRKIDSDETQAYVGNETQVSIANAQDPERVSLGISNLRRVIGQYAQRNGAGPEQTRRAIDSAVSDLHVGVIGRLLDQGDDIRAKVYYEHAQAEIDGTKQGSIEKALDVGSTAGDASRAGADIWMKHGPQTEEDPVSMDKLANEARAMFPDDPKRANATIAELKERKIEFDAGVKDRRDSNESQVWQMALAGTPLAQIKTTSQYRSLDGKKQTEVSEHVVNRLYELDQRAKSAADYLRNRAFEAESRAHTRKAWEKQDKDAASYERYEELLSDPQAFSKMSEDAIIKELPNLGRTLMNDLLTRRKALAGDSTKPIAAAVDSSIFNDVAFDAGFRTDLPAGSRPKGQNEKLGALRAYVNGIIDQEQRDNKNERLSYERQREIMEDALLKTPAFKAGSWLSIIPGGAPFFDTNFAKRAFEMSTADLPPGVADDIKRRLMEKQVSPTESAVIQYYLEQVRQTRK